MLTRLPTLRTTALGLSLSVCSAGVYGSALGQVSPFGSTSSCVSGECHVSILNRKVMHGPVAQQKCAACHVEVDSEAHRFSIAGDPAKLCTTCHVMPERTYAHAPVKQGNCIGCHDPHGSDHAVMLIADPTRGLCVNCHHEEANGGRFVHGPVATGACIVCHESHSAWHPALLVESPRNLCLGCHAEIEADPVRDRYRHAPVEEGCSSCHDAHASDVRHQLHEEAPGLCYRCHESTRDELRTASVVHGATTVEGGCLVCHGAHASSLPALQRQEEIKLCLDCHDRPMKASGGRTITDMARLLRENPDHHGPIREGSCTACHLPHAAPEPLLLRQTYPPEFYASYDPEQYALCFECHVPEMVRSERGRDVTGFRNGDMNLHWLHVNREKGRTCRACHEIHASRNPFHMRDSVPFGRRGWALEIGFTRTAGGGSCLPGCHVRQEYDRGLDPLPVEPAAAVRPSGVQP